MRLDITVDLRDSPKLLLMTNRKLHNMCIRLAVHQSRWPWMTLNCC